MISETKKGNQERERGEDKTQDGVEEMDCASCWGRRFQIPTEDEIGWFERLHKEKNYRYDLCFNNNNKNRKYNVNPSCIVCARIICLRIYTVLLR